ncbi:MarR family winged helix-turn-helix transcriptional regulator [Paenibacillus arenosi]|uniref:Winged helix-turn-helix transcriptional regulator n=1 Tax=Paenibacillus arenosi TaxID=2774142 RepID=A0ABR9AXI8_9BACL|nr:MarR family winged helix-turn-helix transcriptional regulator [Paenibacillus arenosi]MBD8498413.1 winged helix-turn-helix transcriptional regulator [Paenibacillus arenosi]
MVIYKDNPPAIDVIHMLIRSTQYMQREFDAQLAAVDVPFQISGPRLRLLSIVSATGKIRMNELACQIGVKARTVTDFVDALEKEKLLVRLPDPTDRRATLLQTTELAEQHLHEVLDSQKAIAESLLTNLTEEQRAQFYRLLFQLMENKDMSLPDTKAFK